MCILANLWWHLLTLEKLAVCAYLNVILDGNCGKSGKTNLIFCMMLPVGVILCMPGQYPVFPPLADIITPKASWHACYKALQAFCRDFCPFIQQGLAELTKILGRVVHTSDCTAQFIQNMCCGVEVWRSWRLLHLGDVALLKEIKDYPSMVRCSVIILVAVYPWNTAWQMALRCFAELTSEVSVGEHKRQFGTSMKSSPDVYWTTTSLDPISLAPLLEALSR